MWCQVFFYDFFYDSHHCETTQQDIWWVTRPQPASLQYMLHQCCTVRSSSIYHQQNCANLSSLSNTGLFHLGLMFFPICVFLKITISILRLCYWLQKFMTILLAEIPSDGGICQLHPLTIFFENWRDIH